MDGEHTCGHQDAGRSSMKLELQRREGGRVLVTDS